MTIRGAIFYLASIELIDGAENGFLRSFEMPQWASSTEMSRPLATLGPSRSAA
jgi:hypothetical protein